MNREDVALARILALRLAGDLPATPVDVVRHLGCVQGQDLAGAMLAVALRTPHRSLVDVRQAFDDGQLVRSWPMRGTLHLVAAEDIGWMCALTAPRMFKQSATRRRQLGLDEAMIAAAGDLAEAAISERGPLSRAEVLALWEGPGFTEVAGRGYHLLSVLCYTGRLVQGPLRDKEQLFCRQSDWIPQPRKVSGDEALGEWARRYFTSHGPATIADFVRWTGLLVSDAKRGVAVAGEDLVSVAIGDTTYLMDPRLPDLLAQHRSAAKGLFVLPGFDELILGYRDRSVTLAPEHEELVVPGRNGMFRPTVVLGGTVRGAWKRKGKRFETETFPGVRFPSESRVDEALSRLPGAAE